MLCSPVFLSCLIVVHKLQRVWLHLWAVLDYMGYSNLGWMVLPLLVKEYKIQLDAIPIAYGWLKICTLLAFLAG